MGTWKIELDRAAERDFDKLDPQVTRRIERFLHERVAPLDNPRLIGEALHDIEPRKRIAELRERVEELTVQFAVP